MGEAVVRDGLEVLFVLAVGGMLWSAVRRLRAGQIRVYRCGACGRPTSRAYPDCTRCGTPLGHETRLPVGGRALVEWRRGASRPGAADNGGRRMPRLSTPVEAPLPQGEAKVQAVREMFDAIAPRYDLVNRVMTFRMDVGWRRTTVRSLGLSPGSLVVDVAAGTGDLCRALDAAGLRPVGIDLSWGMLAHASTDVPLVQADALRMPFAGETVAGLTCGFALRNLVDLGAFLTEAARVLRTGGRMALLEVAAPSHPVLRWGHGVYFGHVVPRIGGLLSDAAAYRYLPRSVAYLPPTPDLLELIRDSGFTAVERRALSGGISQLITATRGSR